MLKVRVLTVIALGALLAGCAGYLPPKPLPDWAMSRPTPAEKAEVQKHARATPSRPTLRHSSARLSASSTDAVATGSMRRASPPEDSEILPFTKEWYAREEAIDARLRQRLHICNGC
jgi:hypothetical protein